LLHLVGLRRSLVSHWGRLQVKLPEQVLGLTRLLLIALRVLTLIEIVLRAKLAASDEKLDGLHEAHKDKKEGKPTAKRMLRAVAGLEMTLSLIEVGEKQWWYLPALPHLPVRVLELLGLSTSLYTNLSNPCPRLPPQSLAPLVLDSRPFTVGWESRKILTGNDLSSPRRRRP
jgi:hypothetical protein